jgi:hypothetical protein
MVRRPAQRLVAAVNCSMAERSGVEAPDGRGGTRVPQAQASNATDDNRISFI